MKEISFDIIERGLKDSDCDVRQAAMNACIHNGYDLPIIRTIEPPRKYIKSVLVELSLLQKFHVMHRFEERMKENAEQIKLL